MAPWPYTEVPEDEQQMRHWVLRADAFRTQANQWTGRVEGLLAKHWPELNSYLELNSATLLKILIHYGTPAALASDTNAANQLRSWDAVGLLRKRLMTSSNRLKQREASRQIHTKSVGCKRWLTKSKRRWRKSKHAKSRCESLPKTTR